MVLTPAEARVLASLVEKQVTTPQAYPLSLLAVVAACNQTSNRDPVLHLSEAEVEAALTSLRERGLTRLVHPRHGRSVTKYRQVADEVLGLDDEERAVLCLLVLRGPQTPAELRARAERLADLPTVQAAEAAIDRLARRDDPLVVRLGRRPGQKEGRVAHLLTGAVADAPEGADREPAAPAEGRAEGRAEARRPDDDRLADEVTALRAEVAALRHDLEELRRRVG